MRFNPPPNWPPPPPGWSPLPGWQPDPWWPPPPPGWPLWVPDPPRRPIGLIIGTVIAFLAFAAVIGFVIVTRFLPGASPEASDEERIRAIVQGLEETYNESDFTGFRNYLCHEIRRHLVEEYWHTDERWSLTVDSVEVAGDKAHATVTNGFDGTQEAETEDITFVREEGDWKACSE